MEKSDVDSPEKVSLESPPEKPDSAPLPTSSHGSPTFVHTESKAPLTNGESTPSHSSKRKKHWEDESESAIKEMKDLQVKEDLAKDSKPTKSDGTESTHKLEIITPVPAKESGDAVSVPGSGSQSTEKSNASGFIFGQNLTDRITNVPTTAPSFATFGSLASSSTSGFGFLASAVKPFGFSAAKTEKSSTEVAATTSSDKDLVKEEKKDSEDVDKESTQQKLEKIASKEYEAQNQKVVLDEVDVVTGEEGESNVFEINVKLYGFDNTSRQWKERGRTNIRLNDAQDNSYSRLVVRMAGTGRIIINTKLWKDMTVTRISDKNVSFTAFDTEENTLKVFLISCSPADADTFFSELGSKIDRLKHSKTNGKTEETDTSRAINPPKEQPEQPAKKPKLYDESKD